MASDPNPTQDERNPTPIGPGDDLQWLLLSAVATARPLNEVTSLVHLLNRAGGYPRPGDQALRLAAVTRSVKEVHQLIALLHEPPNSAQDAQTALRAAALDRPIEDVAALIASFGPDGIAPRPAGSPEEPVAIAPPAPDAAVAVAEAPPIPDAVAAALAEALTAPIAVAAAQTVEPPAPIPVTAAQTEVPPAYIAEAAAQTVEPPAPIPAAATQTEVPPAPIPAAATQTEVPPAPTAVAAAQTEIPPTPDAVPAAQTAAAARTGGLQPVRSVLRWPAAVALLVIGAIHLPADFMDLRSENPGAGVSVIIAAVCLALACLLALHDPLWAWMAGAGAALGTMVIHSLAAERLLRNSLGSEFTGAPRLLVLCAIIAAVLATTVLARKLRPHTVNQA
ncbi:MULTISPECIES: hypothetical protein [unclassified Streptomyces]|uniref:hypothetical protein n=1 Tax=unclassified Streptomyces TaxID=2593676 RepID=UPI0038178A5B